MKKILLIYPPVTRPRSFSSSVVRVSAFFPLGLAYIASILLESKKYEVGIIDALAEGNVNSGTPVNNGQEIRYGLTDEVIKGKIESFAPDVVGVSCLFAASQKDMENICRLTKKISKEIKTVVGGHHAASTPERIMKLCPDIDFIIEGEGELAMLDLLSYLGDESCANYPAGIQAEIGISSISRESTLAPVKNKFSLDGVVLREDGLIKTIPKTRFIENLDKIPRPAYHLFDMQRYFDIAKEHGFSSGLPYTQMVTTRGCPCKCTFCTLAAPPGLPNRLVQRRRSVQHVLDEMEYLIETYGVREIHFEDDNLTANKRWAANLFDGMIERKLDVEWHVPSGIAAYTLDDQLLDKMKASGCNSITIAIESGVQEVLSNLMNKPLKLDKIPALVKAIRKRDIDVRGFFMLGFPGETKENMRETVSYARNLELDWTYFSVTSPLPGTKIYKKCIEKGYIKESDFDNLTSFHRAIITTPEFDPQFVEDLREEAIVDVCFHNNPNLRKYNVDKAIASFTDVLSKYPHFDFANFYLGEALSRKGDIGAAILSYQNTLKYNPDHNEAKKRLAELKGYAGRTSENMPQTKERTLQ